MMCDGCHNDNLATTGAIINGKYGQYCLNCRSNNNRQASAGSAQHSRDRDREINKRDLLQPWDGKGNPSKDFIREYPEEAHDMFSQEQLEQFG